jgi:hypothetical protein
MPYIQYFYSFQFLLFYMQKVVHWNRGFAGSI